MIRQTVAILVVAVLLSFGATTLVNVAGDHQAGVAYAQNEGDGDNNQSGTDEADGDNNQSGTDEADGNNNDCDDGIDPVTGLPCL